MLKGYVCAIIYGPIDREMIIAYAYTTTLPLVVLTQRNLAADFIRLNFEFYSKIPF